MATSAGRPSFGPSDSGIPDPDLLIAEANARTRRRRRRNAGIAAAALAVIAAAYAFSGGSSAPAPPRGDGAQAGTATARGSDSEIERAMFGEPVELDGMTFVAKGLAPVQSIPGADGVPLTAKAGARLWLFTVSVRNDSSAVEADPFCRGRRRRLRMGAELWFQRGREYHWQTESRLIAGNDQLCGEIAPGATETYQLAYPVPTSRVAVAGVMLGHRAPESDHRSFAMVARSVNRSTRTLTFYHGVWRVLRGGESVGAGPD